MIRDLEEHLLSISDSSGREFMTEAVRCYHAGAFRAAVVTAVAAGMNDLRLKLTSLASSGGAPAPLIASVGAINTKFVNQDVFERDAVAAAESDAQMLSGAEAKALRGLLDTRNLCAHPSGHAGAPEEARHVITAIIDLVMARPGILGMVGVNEILGRLPSATFFPVAGGVDAHTTVTGELARVHASLYPAVVVRIIDVIKREVAVAVAAGSQALSTEHKNALKFLRGMVAAGGAVRECVWKSKRLEDLVHLGPDRFDVLTIFQADTSGLQTINPLTRARVLELVRRGLLQKTPRNVAKRAVESAVLTAGENDDLFNAAVATLITKWTADTPAHVAELAWPRLEEAFLDALVERCGSGTFATANAAIDVMQEMPVERAAGLGDVRMAQYILHLARVGSGPYPARSADAIVRNGLGARGEAVDAFLRECQRNPTALREQRTNWDTLASLFKGCGRLDAVTAVVTLFQPPTAKIPLELVTALKEWPEPDMAAHGTALEAEWQRRRAAPPAPA